MSRLSAKQDRHKAKKDVRMVSSIVQLLVRQYATESSISVRHRQAVDDKSQPKLDAD